MEFRTHGFDAAPSSEAHLVLFGRKKSLQNKNFDDHITTMYLALMPRLTVTTMEVFLSLAEFWATSEPKSGGAS